MESNMNTKTREEIEHLKRNWLSDPCWDIEDTEGFEAHRDELAEFAAEQELIWTAHAEARRVAFAEAWGLTDNPTLAEKIERLVNRVEELERQRDEAFYRD